MRQGLIHDQYARWGETRFAGDSQLKPASKKKNSVAPSTGEAEVDKVAMGGMSR